MARLVLSRASTRAIVAGVRISLHGADHLKAVLDEIGVPMWRQPAGRLLGDAAADRSSAQR